jgi:hypothetical protein
MKIIDADYTESYLLPPSIEDWVGKSHPARFIREMVEQINLNELGIKDQKPVEGRPPYANGLLLRVWLYGYWKRHVEKILDFCGYADRNVRITILYGDFFMRTGRL